MNLEIIGQLMQMLEESCLTAMEVEECGFRIRLENAALHPTPLRTVVEGRAPFRSNRPAADPEPSEDAPTDDAAEIPDTPRGAHDVKSPMVGTFHERKGGRVGVGTALKQGDPVCVIEAMKVMNEILMEQDGVITYVAAKEGDMVEFGQILYMFD